MKNKTFVLAWVLLISEIVLAGTYSGGSGEPNDPYRIADANDLNALAANPSDWGKHFILTADIDLPTTTYTTAVVAPDMDNSNYRFDGIAFTGVFDGNGHRIINLTIDTHTGSGDYLALFGAIDSGGQVKNLGLENVTVTGGDHSGHLGGLAGLNQGSITNCYSTASVSGGDDSGLLGGLVGSNWNSSITNCFSAGSVVGGDYSENLGGLVGDNQGSISNCYSTAAVTGGDDSWCVGGLVGDNSGSISNCYSNGSVTGGFDSERLAGLVAWNWGAISNCYSTVAVTGADDSWGVGGLVGENMASISNCYSTGSVTGGNDPYRLGGLVGWDHGWISASSWDVETSGMSTSDGGEGRTTAEMKKETTFTEAGWDFVEVWDIGENQTYPFLRTHTAGDINHDDKVNYLDLAILSSHWLEGI